MEYILPFAYKSSFFMRDVIPFLCPLCRMSSRFYVHCVGCHPVSMSIVSDIIR